MKTKAEKLEVIVREAEEVETLIEYYNEVCRKLKKYDKVIHYIDEVNSFFENFSPESILLSVDNINIINDDVFYQRVDEYNNVVYTGGNFDDALDIIDFNVFLEYILDDDIE